MSTLGGIRRARDLWKHQIPFSQSLCTLVTWLWKHSMVWLDLSPEGPRLDRFVEDAALIWTLWPELILTIPAQRDAMKQGGVRAQVWLGPLSPHPS